MFGENGKNTVEGEEYRMFFLRFRPRCIIMGLDFKRERI